MQPCNHEQFNEVDPDQPVYVCAECGQAVEAHPDKTRINWPVVWIIASQVALWASWAALVAIAAGVKP